MQGSVRGFFFILVILLVPAGLQAADNPFIGAWKFNADRSKPGDRSATLTFAAYGADGLKFTRDIIEATGNPAYWEWSANFDGKDYKFTGSPNYDSLSVKHVDSNTFLATHKKGGKVMTSAWYTVSKDGKMLGVTTAGVNAQGKEVLFFSVYDKQ